MQPMQSSRTTGAVRGLVLPAPFKSVTCTRPFLKYSLRTGSGPTQRPAPQRAIPILAAGAVATEAAVALKAANPLDIVFVSTEVAPWSKTGGLGDVVGSLPVELAKRGHNVFSIAPRFDQYFDAWDTSTTVEIDGESVGFFHSVRSGVHRVWVDHPWFLAKVYGKTGSKLYGAQSGADFADNPRRFALFCKAAIESLTALPFMPGEDAVLVANDWHTSLIPVLLKDVYQPAGQFTATKVALTVHNAAFQGRFWPESFASMGLPEVSRERFAFEDGYPKVFDELSSVEENSLALAPKGARFAKLNWLRAGITACDKLLTVSPNYALEIASGPALGVELDDVIRAKGVEGIVNGMDVADWSPALDRNLSFKYNEDNVEAGKAFAKAELQKAAGLPLAPAAPLFGFIGRLEEQKGVDILLAALDHLPAALGAQVVVLGTGKASLEAEVKNLANRFPGAVAGVVEFNNQVAHLITAGADFMMVPSRFEPCGLIQLHAMAYGTVPVVASTGGLVDTVKEGVTGFQMGAMDPDGLEPADAEAVAATMARAAEVYGTSAYVAMRAACIAQDLSWAAPARKWEGVLTELKFGAAAAPEAAAQKAAVPTPVTKIDNPTAFPDAPGPKPSEVAVAIAASKGAAPPGTPPVSPAAAAAAKALQPAAVVAAAGAAAPTPRAAAAAQAKATVATPPAPIPPVAKKAAAAGAPAAKAPAAAPAAKPATAAAPAAAAAAPAPAAASNSSAPAAQKAAPKRSKTTTQATKTTTKAAKKSA